MTKKQLQKIIDGIANKDCDFCICQHTDNCPNSKVCYSTICKPYFQPEHKYLSNLFYQHSTENFQADLRNVALITTANILNSIEKIEKEIKGEENG